jgi:hypothetical protein
MGGTQKWVTTIIISFFENIEKKALFLARRVDLWLSSLKIITAFTFYAVSFSNEKKLYFSLHPKHLLQS